MKTSLSWIKSYVPDLDVTVQEYIDRMTLTGTKVEGSEVLDADLDKIVVGRIDKMEKHPDADKLLVCQVYVGDETVQIVTGATNVKEGDKIPIVLVGGSVAGNKDGEKTPGGMKIEAGKIRGVESFGMMCSIEELGSTPEMYPEAPEDGIYIFPEETEIGIDAVAALGLRDVVFEYEITSNRVDCYSVLGIARESAATFGKPFYPPEVIKVGNQEDVNDYLKVTVEDSKLCPRFCARVIKNVTIKPSPFWLQRRLSALGIRPINNLVDITNYLMEEYGQPMHAYNLEQIAGQHIVVKRAKDGETFTTLDGQKRELNDEVLMICDGEKAIGIAGIMGGENTMITDDVSTVALEVACFGGVNIRTSSKRVGLRTDASGKFEKGLDPHSAFLAMERACQLVEELGVGEVVGGIIDVSEELKEPIKVVLDAERINAMLGTEISHDQMVDYLLPLGFSYDAANNEVTVPSSRKDVTRIADLAEEVARYFGYDNIPTTLPTGEATAGKISFKMQVEKVARTVAEHAGFSESMSYSFESPKVFERLLLEPDSALRKGVEISNPLGEDYSIMRTSTIHGMLTSLATNYNRRNKDVRLYELGNIYLPHQLPIQELPDERMQFTLGMYGEGDFFTMKGVVEEFLEKAGLFGARNYQPDSGKPFLHPGRQANIEYQGKMLGFLGELHPLVATNYKIGQRTYLAVLDMPVVDGFATFDRKYQGIARFPSITRDLSLTIDKQVMVGTIEKVIREKGGAYLEECTLFDVYEGEQIQKGLKSVAYSLTFRSKDKTLEEADIAQEMDEILAGLEAIGAELRR